MIGKAVPQPSGGVGDASRPSRSRRELRRVPGRRRWVRHDESRMAGHPPRRRRGDQRPACFRRGTGDTAATSDRSASHSDPYTQCAVTRRRSSAGANPARQLSLQPVAIGADDGGNDIVRSTPRRAALGGSATMRAATRVNAEQASKRLMRKPTRLSCGEGCQRSGSERREHRPVPPGYWRRHAWKRGTDRTREALPVAWHAPTDSPRGSGRAGQGGGEARSTGEAG